MVSGGLIHVTYLSLTKECHNYKLISSRMSMLWSIPRLTIQLPKYVLGLG